MDKRKVDVVILGMATAGLNAYRAAKKADASALIIDKGPLVTTWARVGCMPPKFLSRRPTHIITVIRPKSSALN